MSDNRNRKKGDLRPPRRREQKFGDLPLTDRSPAKVLDLAAQYQHDDYDSAPETSPGGFRDGKTRTEKANVELNDPCKERVNDEWTIAQVGLPGRRNRFAKSEYLHYILAVILVAVIASLVVWYFV